MTKKNENFMQLLNKNKKWEILLFVSPVCNSSCSHCWSYNTYLGKMVDLDWFRNFFSNLNPEKVKMIKLTGGETTMYPHLAELLSLIREYLPASIPIIIFTNGRKIVPYTRTEDSVNLTVQNIQQLIGENQNISLQMSADEHHAGSLFRAINKKNTPSFLKNEIMKDNLTGLPFLKNMVFNFLDAVKIIEKRKPDLKFEGKLKIHCETGRLNFHKEDIYQEISKKDWEKYVIATEGLIAAGNARNLQKSIKIKENNDFLSAFVFPGAVFSKQKIGKSETYLDDCNNEYYLLGSNIGKDSGIVMLGWWNIINRIYCAETTQVFLNMLK